MIHNEFLFRGNDIILNLIGLFKEIKKNTDIKINIKRSNKIRENITLENLYTNIQKTYFHSDATPQQDALELLEFYFNNIIFSFNNSINLLIYHDQNIGNSQYEYFLNNINLPFYELFIRIIYEKKCKSEEYIFEKDIQFELFKTFVCVNDIKINLDTTIESNHNKKCPPFIRGDDIINTQITTSHKANKYLLIKVLREYSQVYKKGKKIRKKVLIIQEGEIIPEMSTLFFGNINYNIINQDAKTGVITLEHIEDKTRKTINESDITRPDSNYKFKNDFISTNSEYINGILYFTDDNEVKKKWSDISEIDKSTYDVSDIERKCNMIMLDKDTYFEDIDTERIYPLNYINQHTDIYHTNPLVNYDSDILNFNDNINNDEQIYESIGCICKSGSGLGGHYWYFHKINRTWYIFNDDDVPIIKTPDTKHIILILYRRKDADYKIPIYENVNDMKLDILKQIKDNVMTYDNVLPDNLYKDDKLKGDIKRLLYYTSIGESDKSSINKKLLDINKKFKEKINLILK
jgi:hypothetical protein